MDTETYFNKIYAKFKQDNFKLQKDKINSFDVTVATKKQFKLSWLATQMNFFAIMGVSKNITQETIENYSENCLDYAIKNHKVYQEGYNQELHLLHCSFHQM